MESNAMPGGVYSNVQQTMLGLEMSLHHPLQSHNPKNPHHMSQPHHLMVAGDYHLQPQQSAKQGYPSSAKSKNQSLTLSDDDDPGFTAENSADDGKRKMSPWQRMKWTDNMVRLLIMVVFYIGDEVGSEANDPGGKKKGGGGVLQKKGKWKSVSRAMMERGFYVSPQQCEDKFNDLNKRYKRVNDILGKGTSCRVVENQSLLDTMDHLSPKMKEEVKKLLNSKHLFFREMCAYHNSCGHGNGNGGASGSGNGGLQHSPNEGSLEPAQKQRCLHSREKSPVMPNLNRVENEGSKLRKGMSGEEEEEEEEDEDDGEEDDDDEEDEDEEEEEVVVGRGHMDDGHDMEERFVRKRTRKGRNESPSIQQLDVEMRSVLQDGTRSPLEKREWMKTRLVGLEEQHVEIQSKSFELEKQRLKWLKYSSKKEREMEREKLMNERLKLENERMVLLIRQKGLLDLAEHQHQHQHQHQHSSNRRSDPSSITG